MLTMSSWDPRCIHSHQECHSLRSLPRGDTWYTWDCALTVHLGNRAAGTRRSINRPPGTVHSPSTWLPEWLGPGNSTKCPAHQGLCCCRAAENLSGLAPEEHDTQAHLGQCPCDHPDPEQCGPQAMLPWLLQTQCGPSTAHSLHMPAVLPVSPSPQHNSTSDPK